MRPSLLLVLLLVSIPAASGDSAYVELEVLQQQLAETLEANDIPGAGIALVRDGEVLWAGGIGHARIDPEQYVVSDTRFRIGSVTKMFTSLAVLKLVEQGKLSLDQPVHEIAPEVPIENPWQESHPVTIAHLLEHTAGFDDMHFRNMNTDEPLPDSLFPTIERLRDELVVRWQPGVKHAYSNPGYAVAGYLVEKITQQPFHRYLSEEVLEPMGLENAAWYAPEESHVARGYVRVDKNRFRPVDPRAIRLYPAGELSMSPAELARVVQFFLQRGAADGKRLLPEALIRRMEQPRTTRAAEYGLENGYGLGNYASFREGFRLYGHNGGLDGFAAVLAYSPTHDFGYVVLINRNEASALRVLENQLTTFLARDVDAPRVGVFDKPDAQVSDAIAGCYRMKNSRNELLRGLEWLVQVACIEKDDNGAIIRHPVLPQVTRLVPVRGALLRESDSAWPSAAFMQSDDREDALQWAGIYFERVGWASAALPLAGAIVVIALMASSLLFFPVWILLWWNGRLRMSPAVSARAWPALATLLLAFTLFMATRLELSLLDSANVVTLSIFFGGIAFALVSFFALYRVIHTWCHDVHPAVRWHTLLVAVACALLTLYLAWWKLVPLGLWAW